MKKLLTYPMMCLLLALLSMGLISCSSSPGVAPSPPTEIPAFLSFPATVTMGTGELPTGSVSPPVSISKGMVEDNNRAIIASGNDIADAADEVVNVILAVFNGVEFPTCGAAEQSATLEGTDDNGHYLQTSYCTQAYCERTRTRDNGNTTILMIAFSDYNVSTRSGAVNCSGTTAPVSDCSTFTCDSSICSSTSAVTARNVCFRSWTSTNSATPERFLAGFFNEVPCRTNAVCLAVYEQDVESNPGSGEYRVELISGAVTQNTGVVYDHYDSADANAKNSDVGIINFEDGTTDSTARYHVVVNQQTSGGDVLKELLVYADEYLGTNPSNWTTRLDYVSRFFENGAYWRGTVVTNGSELFDNQCIEIATGIEVSSGNPNCTPLDVTGLAIDAPTTTDVEMPNTTNFPSNPCDVNQSFSVCR